MSRLYNQITVDILKQLLGREKTNALELKNACAKQMSGKDFYNYLFRLTQQELIKKTDEIISLTEDGKKLLKRLSPERDNEWKLIIFDIPEKHKYVRTVLRAKLKQLHFKKWQNSIWASPYKMDEEIEAELDGLGKKFFVRLIKTKDINHTEDLEKLFPK